MKTVALIFCSIVCTYALGQQAPRIPVVFDCHCNDRVGALYATAVRDLLAESPRFAETRTAEGEDATGKFPIWNWHLSVISLDPEKTGKYSAISVVILMGKTRFVDQQIQWCPSNDVAGCATTTLSALDADIQDFK